MPIYEYECKECKTVVEMIFPINDFPTEIQCTLCFNSANKIMSRNTFQLIGQGWAKDGYIGKFDRFDDAMKCEF